MNAHKEKLSSFLVGKNVNSIDTKELGIKSIYVVDMNVFEPCVCIVGLVKVTAENDTITRVLSFY